MAASISQRPLPNDSDRLLSHGEAFAAMSLFIYQFASRAGDDLLTLIGDISPWVGDGAQARPITGDPAAWDDWLDCVAEVRAKGLSGPQPNPFTAT